MEIRGALVLGGRVAGAMGRILADRVEEMLGGALPRNAEQLARPAVVNELIRSHAPSGDAPLPPVSAVRLAGVEFESSNCTNFLIELDFEGEASPGEILPRTAYVKLPCAENATRAFANAVGFWEVEATFCERLAARVPIRVPRVYAVVRRGARFVLLLENLQEVDGARLFINRDMAAGTNLERAHQCIDTFAELHAPFWGWTKDEQEGLIPARLHTYLAPGGRELTRALNAAAVGPAQRAAPDEHCLAAASPL